MGKVVKGVLIGGLIGAAVAGVKSLQSDQPSEQAGGEVAKTAMGAAAVGGFIGLVLTRREKRRQAKRRVKLGGALTAAGLAEGGGWGRAGARAARGGSPRRGLKAAEAARPALEQAAEV